MVDVDSKLHGFRSDGLGAHVTLLADFINEAGGAHQGIIVVMKLPVNEPGATGDTLEAFWVPVSILVAEMADRRTYAFFASIALDGWLYAFFTEQVILSPEVALFP